MAYAERDEAARAAWRERVSLVGARRFVWVDETGSHVGFAPTRGRAPRGRRARGGVPRNRGRVTTTIASLALDGMGPALMVEGGAGRAAFVASVERVLAPALRPGRIVALDNLAAHHAPRARELVEARGAAPWFLPPYSPDQNPIEEAFSKTKAALRPAAARTADALAGAIRDALRAVTPRDALGRALHAGYIVRAQLP